MSALATRILAFLGPFDGEFRDDGMRNAFRLVLGAGFFFFPFGVFFITLNLLPASLAWMGAATIGLYAAMAMISEFRAASLRITLTRALLLGTFLFAVEWIGVGTGHPFGDYVYTDNLVVLVAGVPVAIALAWYGVIVSSWRLARAAFPKSGRAAAFWVAAMAALYATALDVALEPMAAFVQQYWIWDDGTVPLQNYASWFGLAFIAVLLLDITDSNCGRAPVSVTRTALLVYGLQGVVFTGVALAHGFFLEALLAVSIAGVLLTSTGVRSAVRRTRHV